MSSADGIVIWSHEWKEKWFLHISISNDLLNLKYLYRIVKWYWIKWYSNILYINFHSLLKRKSICFPKWLFRSTAHIGNYYPSRYLPANLLSKTNYSNKWKSGKIIGSHHMNHASSSHQCVMSRRWNCKRSARDLIALRTWRKICRSYKRYIWIWVRKVEYLLIKRMMKLV